MERKPIQIICTCSRDGREGCYVPHVFLEAVERLKASGHKYHDKASTPQEGGE